MKYFVSKGINVFLWNYRGYGRSTGTPTPNNLIKDADAVYNYVVNVLKVTGKIGVYGRSLGGIPSSQLANTVDLAIIDRTFTSLSAMARFKFYGKVASIIFSFVSFGWQV